MNETQIIHLSPRQREVVLWIARGKTMPEIGLILGRAETTVRYHLRLARHRLHATNCANAVAKAMAAAEIAREEIT
jgi:DNA-binding CsgD family transcriptional regulator